MTTASLCRDQQAFHRDRADGTTLENVRAIATKAAATSGREAIRAERREASGEQRRIQAGTLAPAACDATQACAPNENPMSENPDRGFASP